MSTMKVEIDASDIQTRKADDRGRVTLGADYAGRDVTVAVLEVSDPE